MSVSSKICVLGGGGWGTALSCLLASKDLPVALWTYEPAQAECMRASRANPDFLPGIILSSMISVTADMEEAVTGADVLVVVVPSKAMRQTAQSMAASGMAKDSPVLSCTKGIEFGSGLRMSQILKETLPASPVAVLSGPSHAEEVARGVPAAVVVGSEDTAVAASLQVLFSTGSFRVYTGEDVAGIELGGALKNIFAVGAGVCDGLGLGDNAKAAFVTRSLAELSRLGCALGGRQETFYGLSGVGDLMVTCFSRHSRNRGVGERLGKGESLDAISASTPMIAEGVPTTRSAHDFARRLGIETPVIDRIHAILFEGQAPAEALRQLLDRELRPE